ncbi:MAG: hypothetical protein ACP5I3_11155, partial [Thermoproteus sp.]
MLHIRLDPGVFIPHFPDREKTPPRPGCVAVFKPELHIYVGLKEEFLRLLREDEEFRLAVAGL